MDAIEQETESAPSQLPADVAPPPSADDGLTELLREFEEKVAQQPEPAADPVEEEAQPDLDQQIQDLIGPDPKIAELNGQLSDLRTQLHQQQELKALDEFAEDLTKQLAEWLPDGYARLKLESYAHDPVVRLAWDTRNIDPKAAAVDLAHVQHALAQLQVSGNADPAKVQQLNTLAHRLSVATQSASILRQARNQILKEAGALKPPLDPEATADRNAIAQFIRDGQGPINIPEPKPNFGTMSDREFRDYTRKNFGF